MGAMKLTLQSREMIANKLRAYLAARFPAVLETIRQAPDKVSTAELWTLWFHVCDETRFPDDHGRFKDRARVLPHDFNFPLYPDGTNDATLETGLKAVLKML